jgi:chemotaxis protein methyltransferase CheR
MIKDNVLSEYKTQAKIRMWHAGCSTGEEVYSMAAVLAQSYLLHKSETIATDLSSRALEKAEKGIYSALLKSKYEKGLLTSFPDSKFDDIFHIRENEVHIKKRYKTHIEFKRHNLVSDPMNQTFDIIFCRNVMIYFDDVLKMNVLSKFHKSLALGGFFVIGYYDMLPQESKTLFELYDATTRVYKKIG